MAAVKSTNLNESTQTGLETFILKKGEYHSMVILDFLEHIEKIGEAFHEILQKPDIDPNGCCAEWYLSEKEVRCMVHMDSK